MFDKVQAIAAEGGFEIVSAEDDVLTVRHPETGIKITSTLQYDDDGSGGVLLNTLQCKTVDSISEEDKDKMLDAANGIATSGFKVIDAGKKKIITLNNIAKLQDLGEDDKDDILSCLNFLIVDAFAANNLLAEQKETAKEPVGV